MLSPKKLDDTPADEQALVLAGALQEMMQTYSQSYQGLRTFLARFDPEYEEETAATAAREQQVSPGIFRAYDIRGIVGATLSARVIRTIGQAIGNTACELGQNCMVIARDGRVSSPELGEALIDGLRTAGCDVINIGTVPTPVLYFATHHLTATSSGVMITGSHNDPDYNGLKIVLDGNTLSGDAIQALYRRIPDNQKSARYGQLITDDVKAAYLKSVIDALPKTHSRLKLVIDCGNGVAGWLAPQLYRYLGHDVVTLFCKIDGRFPNHQPDPSQPQNLQSLIETVREEDADLGFAFDGDGDRLGVVDKHGTIIWPDRQMMLFAQDVLKRHPKAPIIFDVKCSRHLKNVIKISGGVPLMWKTGHSLIKSKMKEVNAPLAGEMSGHFFFGDGWYGFDDALYAGARLLAILAQRGDPSEVFASLPDSVSTPELRIPVPESEQAKIMWRIREHMSFDESMITDIDGIRVDFPNGFGLVRPSNTSPCLTVRFEADDQTTLEDIQTKFRALLKAAEEDLALPF